MVRSESTTTAPALLMLNTRLLWLPLMDRFAAPGPAKVRLLVTTNSPLVKLTVPLVAKAIVSPAMESAIAWRNEPAPLSATVVTVLVPRRVVKLMSLPVLRPAVLVATTR
jgi:hypothetical protein